MWTEETVETLKRLALEGKSASWIAAEIGAPSRNAVIGKANRIGVKLSGMRPTPNEIGLLLETRPLPMPSDRGPSPKHEVLRSERRLRPEMSVARATPPARNRAPTVLREKRRPDRSVFATAEVGEMRRIGFADISEVECRWPLGDPVQDDFAFCGLPAAKGHSYCAGHCRLSFRALRSEDSKGNEAKSLRISSSWKR